MGAGRREPHSADTNSSEAVPQTGEQSSTRRRGDAEKDAEKNLEKKD
jgi:hypothetical protein